MEICPDTTNANIKSFFLSLNRFFYHLSLLQGSKGGQTTLLNAHICHLPTKRLDLHLFGSRQSQMLRNNSNAEKQLNKLKVGFTVGFQLLSPWSSESCEPLVRPQGDWTLSQGLTTPDFFCLATTFYHKIQCWGTGSRSTLWVLMCLQSPVFRAIP